MTALDDADIAGRWERTVARFVDLLPFFADVRLSMSETQAAYGLGLANADALRRWLLKRHLPPYRVLRDWYYVVVMVERADARNALGRWTMERGDFANVYYRFVEKITGQPWRMIRKHGLCWVKARALAVWAPHLGDDGAGM